MADLAELQHMVMSFRVSELQVLLGFAGRNKTGRKQELLQRALLLLSNCSPPIQIKIRELSKRRFPAKYAQLNNQSSTSPHSSPIKQQPPAMPSAGLAQYSMRGHSDRSADYKDYKHSASVSSNHNQVPVLPDVRLKELPFYDVLDELLKPTSLVAKSTARFQETSHMFYLTPQQAHDIANSREMTSGRIEYSVQVQLRFCLLETSCHQEDNFPPSICVRVNGKMASLPNPIPTNKAGVEPKRPSRPVNITPVCRISPTVPNQLSISWASELGRLGKMRMTIPSRAATCTHLQCFDAPMFLMMNEKKPTWTCPVCDKPALYQNLIIDGLFTDILKKAGECSDIEFLEDGSWHPLKVKSSDRGQDRSKSPDLDSSVQTLEGAVWKAQPVEKQGLKMKIGRLRDESPQKGAAEEPSEESSSKSAALVDLTETDDEADVPLCSVSLSSSCSESGDTLTDEVSNSSVISMAPPCAMPNLSPANGAVSPVLVSLDSSPNASRPQASPLSFPQFSSRYSPYASPLHSSHSHSPLPQPPPAHTRSKTHNANPTPPPAHSNFPPFPSLYPYGPPSKDFGSALSADGQLDDFMSYFNQASSALSAHMYPMGSAFPTPISYAVNRDSPASHTPSSPSSRQQDLSQPPSPSSSSSSSSSSDSVWAS